MQNSARYQGPDGAQHHGILDEGPHAVSFHLGDNRPLFEIPYRHIEAVKGSFARPARMTIKGDSQSHSLTLTGSLIDGEQHGESGWIGTQPGDAHRTREQTATQDALIATNVLVKAIEWIAADRVRRGRIRKRLLAHKHSSS